MNLLQPLAENKIHVWRFSLTATQRDIEVMLCWLSESEHARLEHMGSRSRRDRRSVAWGRLRFILAKYLDCSPGDIQMVREALGQPRIVYPRDFGLSFSLSHSGEHGLVAVSNNSVGVDIERVNPEIDVARLASRFFTPNEAERLLDLPEEERTEAFFRLWVLKEAYLKAHGETVPAGLSKYEFALEPNGPCLYDFESMTSVRILAEIPVSAGYVAAVSGLQEKADVSVFDL